MKEFEGKKLLILGGNPETTPLVEVANSMGVKTIVTSGRSTDPAKKVAWKAFDVDGMDVGGIIDLAKEEHVDGVLVGVADILVPSYCKVCKELDFPCYATEEIVNVFSFKDTFKETCEKYGVHGIPEYKLGDEIKYPVMVKPVDNGGSVGMTVCYNDDELTKAIDKALENSHKKKYLIERYMQTIDCGLYYTFKDGYCSVSCVYDGHTTDEQPGCARINLGGTYPSKYIDDYFKNVHENVVKMFSDIGIKNGVLLLQAFYEDGNFYVHDTGFRLQGEAQHLLMKAIHGFDQRELLIRFALTGSEGDIDLKKEDDVYLRGKYAATDWFLLKEGEIGRIEGLDEVCQDHRVVENIQRLYEGDVVPREWVGTEKQVMTRLYLVCDTKEELAETLKKCNDRIKVYDKNGNNMLLKHFDVDEALGL